MDFYEALPHFPIFALLGLVTYIIIWWLGLKYTRGQIATAVMVLWVMPTFMTIVALIPSLLEGTLIFEGFNYYPTSALYLTVSLLALLFPTKK